MKRVPIFLIALLLALFACKEKPRPSDSYTLYDNLVDRDKPIAFGENHDVYLFADPVRAAVAVDIIDSTLSRGEMLTIEEYYFNLIPATMKEFDELSKFKNLIFCGTLSGSDEVSKYIREDLDQELLAKVKASGAELFVVKNHYVRDQIMLYLVARDQSGLAALARLQAEQIFAMLLERYEHRLAYQAYQSKVIKDALFQDLPFSIRIPQTYQLFSNDVAGNFLSFVYQDKRPDRENPDKYISVHYERADANPISYDWLLAKRKFLANTYFKGDSIVEEKLSTAEVNFAGHDALRLRGAWINKDIRGGIGGAFQTFAFWHEPSKTVYVVDNIAYFPRGNKLPVLLELGIVSASLVVKQDQ